MTGLAWAGLLGFLRVWQAEDLRLWQMFAEARFVGLSAGLLVTALGHAAGYALLFAPLGACCVLANRRAAGLRDELRASVVALGIAGVCLLLVIGLEPAGGWRWPGILELVLPTLGCVTGIVLAGALAPARGAATRRALVRLVVLLTAGAAGAAVLVANLLVAEPPAVPATVVTSDERRALVAELRRHNPMRLRGGGSGELLLQPEQLATLLAWSVQLLDPEARGAVSAHAAGQRVLASIRLPGMPARYRHLTLAGELAFEVTHGRLRTDACALSLGSTRIPEWLCRSLLRSLYRVVFGSDARGAIAPAIELLRLDASGLTARYTRPEVDGQFRERLQQMLGPGSEIESAVAAQFDALRAIEALPVAADARFGALLAAAFRLAAARAASGSAVAENQGAILALATVLGHHDVATVAGIERPADWRALRRALQPVGLHGREDWVRHFLVSAAITQFSAAAISDAAGLLKEELDAERRSGFSFGDLLADRAGTRFGELAARSERAARGLQGALAAGVSLGDLMPPGADLPEGMSDTEFEARFGGVGGPGYQAIMAEIEARLATLPVY
ncbi:MAG: hypothetical protein KF911_11140 [Pseudomonadales bacterium]|nr:hypothetical protein [Pseudomonadales bacterium]